MKKKDLSYEQMLNNSKQAGELNRIIIGVLELQLTLTTKNLKNLPNDDFIFGYIYGYADFCYQNSSIKDEESWMVGSLALFALIFGPEVGTSILLNSEKFLNSNKNFNKGIASGSQDAREFIKGKPILRLAEYLNN
jgi:hypothetical protein